MNQCALTTNLCNQAAITALTHAQPQCDYVLLSWWPRVLGETVRRPREQVWNGVAVHGDCPRCCCTWPLVRIDCVWPGCNLCWIAPQANWMSDAIHMSRMSRTVMAKHGEHGEAWRSTCDAWRSTVSMAKHGEAHVMHGEAR